MRELDKIKTHVPLQKLAYSAVSLSLSLSPAKNVYTLLGRAFPGSGFAGECRANSRRRARGLVINFRR